MKIRVEYVPAPEQVEVGGGGDPNYMGHPTNPVNEVYEVLPGGNTKHLGTLLPDSPPLEIPGTRGKTVGFQGHSGEFEI